MSSFRFHPDGRPVKTPSIATFDLNLLRTLHVLLRERSVTRTAKELNVTQQAVSGSLKRLRQHFGDPLLVRVGQHLEATPRALALVAPVRDAMDRIVLTLEAGPSFAPGATRRRFRIAMSDHPLHVVMPPLVAELARTAPGLTCELVPVSRRAVYDLDLGEIDFLIMPREHADKRYLSQGISSADLFDDDFVCVVDEGNPVADEILSVERYADMPHVALRTNDGSRSLVDDSWSAAGLLPRVLLEAGSFADMIWLVPGTPLIATVQRRLARKFGEILPIRIVGYPLPRVQTHQQLIWHSRSTDDPAHRFVRNAFVSTIRDVR